MGVAVVRPTNVRDVPWAVWALLLVAAALLVRGFTAPNIGVISMLPIAGPVVFAAAVLYVKPADRRFVWAALALAATPVVGLIAQPLPDLWFSIVPGDWKNATPLLRDIAGLVLDVARYAGTIGPFVLGLALGGVRSFVPFLIIGLGVLIAVVGLAWTLSNTFEGFPLLDVAQVLAYQALHVTGLAFAFAAAVESLRTFSMIGTGLLFLNAVIGVATLIWPIGPDNFALILLLLGTPSLAWVLLIVAPLRGEFSVRSRAGRGSSAPRRAG